MPSNVCWFIHKWSKWTYEKGKWHTTRNGKTISHFIRTIRTRTCEKCGAIQRENVEDTPCDADYKV